MTPLVDYWLKTNLFLVLFYGCYVVLLRRHTFLTLNRMYLMGSLVLALVLPLLHIPGLSFPWPWETNVPEYTALPVATLMVVGGATVEAETPLLPDWPTLALWAFALVSASLLIRTAWRTVSLFRLIRQWPTQPLEDHTLVLPDNPQTPTFSFFRYLVLNPDDAHTEAVRQHELVHIRQKHSLDVLVLEVIHALYWLNPVLFGYRQAIRQVHEYLADRDATAQIPDHRDAYARFLVSYAFHLPTGMPDHASLAHSFGPDRPDSPTLKQRIQMLYQQHTRRRALWKYALVLPLATALLAMTTEPEPADRSASDTQGLVHVTGYIINHAKRAIPGATIMIRNGKRYTTADADGQFIIDVPASSVLVINSVGFQPLERVIPAMKDYTVLYQLKPLATGVMQGMNVPESGKNPISAVPTKGVNVVDRQPTFPGGMNAMTVYINKNLRYPASAARANIEGKVLLKFLVDTDGSISRINVIKGIQFGCDEEAIRVVREMPNWIPATKKNRPVTVSYNLQVNFQLASKTASKTRPSSGWLVGYSPLDSAIKNSPKIYHNNKTAVIAQPSSLTISKDNPPFILLDGVEIDHLSVIDPNTIQSVEVFKDAATLSRYGEKGKNGVVLITTKKGAELEKKKDR